MTCFLNLAHLGTGCNFSALGGRKVTQSVGSGKQACYEVSMEALAIFNKESIGKLFEVLVELLGVGDLRAHIGGIRGIRVIVDAGALKKLDP